MSHRVLCVAEKPSVARQIAGLLNRDHEVSRTKNKYCSVHSLRVCVGGQTWDLKVTSVLGHVFECDFAQEYHLWTRNSPLELLSAPIEYSPGENMQSIISSLETLAKSCDMLLICTDCDREGEYIGDEIRTICVRANSRIEVRRAYFSGLTRNELLAAFAQSRSLNQGLIDSVRARIELDLRMGSSLTRYQTLKLKKSPDDPVIAEKLYTSGYISYPRTETDLFENNFNFDKVLTSLTSDSVLGSFASVLLEQGSKRPRKGKNNDKAHPPIHPLKGGNGLTGKERRIFEYIARRFIAGMYDDAVFEESVVSVSVGHETFHTKGRRLVAKNYLEVFIYDKISESTIPQFKTGDKAQISKVLLKCSDTSAPLLLSESELIAIMDKNGIGTDATIHEHIQRMIGRGYAVCNNGRFSPTSLGLGLVIGYDSFNFETSLTKPAARAALEKDLQGICDRRVTRDMTIGKHLSSFKTILEAIISNFTTVCGSIEFYKAFPGLSNAPARKRASSSDIEKKNKTKRTASEGTKKRQPRTKPSRQGTSRGKSGAPVENEVKCNCGLIAPVLISKSSESKGKRYARCGKIVHRCQFFQWL